MDAAFQGNVCMKWTDDQKQTLRAMCARHRSAREIGDAIGCSRNAVIGMMHRLGLKNREPRPPRHSIQLFPRRDHRVRYLVRESLINDTPPVRQRKPVEKPQLVSFFDVEHHHCRWPIGDPKCLLTFRFCGADRFGKMPYCKFHVAKSTGVPSHD